ncbi:protein phosphatase 1 regulatory subunit 3B [Osmerus eperlanus]|uniref:protein phosphatase 1 regulatory subunit 3B n=1 Tax=Osmerus eperlanus TaxID=29151 RepID=UPI002E0D9DF5
MLRASYSSPYPQKAIMPVELAISLYQSNDDFCYRTPKSLNPCLTSLNMCQIVEQRTHPNEGEALHKRRGKSKKNVSFADHKGLALTKVKVFSELHDPIDIPLNIQELLNSALTLAEKEDKLVLDFTQPSADYLFFRQRLESERVCLEHCMLKEKALAGTVKVKNLSFEKSVKVRVTFDTWKSYTDVECLYVKDTYTCSDRDTFCFDILLPDHVRPHEHIEFAICYEANSHIYWDSNQDQNYRIIWSSMKRDDLRCLSSSPQTSSSQLGIHFDRYGSPRCSHGIVPEWPSYAGYEIIGPYY